MSDKETEIVYSHFEDCNGAKYHLNGHDAPGEISFIFSDGVLKWYIEMDEGFDVELKLILK